tara:strand:+ start:787 stop:1113 length:327 start_codon:yes stop_codon:yes gene_type:complete
MASERGGLIAGIGRRGPYVRWKPKAGLFQRCMQRKLTGVPKARINASFKQAVKVCKVKSKAMKIVMGGKARKRKTTRRRKAKPLTPAQKAARTRAAKKRLGRKGRGKK